MLGQSEIEVFGPPHSTTAYAGFIVVGTVGDSSVARGGRGGGARGEVVEGARDALGEYGEREGCRRVGGELVEKDDVAGGAGAGVGTLIRGREGCWGWGGEGEGGGKDGEGCDIQ